jgi:selenocysteine lyase/cysteine desulfurase
VVALPQVHWTDGTRFDLERIGQRARHVGAAFVIDGTQSVSAHPFDVQRIMPDAVVCAGYKWLLGPYGLGLAWLGARFDNAEPLEETWIGRLHSEDFQRLVNYRDEYQPGAARFDVGERSSFILLPMLVAALEQVTALGAHRIQQYCEKLTSGVIAEAQELGFASVDASGRGAHLFGLRMPPGIDLGALQRTLEERRIFAALRGNALRLSPNVYNDAEDMAALVDALRAAVSAGTSAASVSTVRGESARAR